MQGPHFNRPPRRARAPRKECARRFATRPQQHERDRIILLADILSSFRSWSQASYGVILTGVGSGFLSGRGSLTGKCSLGGVP